MARWGNCDFRELQALERRLEQLERADFEKVCREGAKKLAGTLLNKVKKRTPVGQKPDVAQDILDQYWPGYVGGTLRGAWEILPIEKHGNDYLITVINNEQYASYVEYGHRQTPGRYVPALGKRLKLSFVPGRYMLTISEDELRRTAPRILGKMVDRALKEAFRGQ